MKIHGFQKMTMLDFPGKVACTLFTAGCNFRCPFCHNALLVTEIDAAAVYDEEEIFSYLQKRRGILDGVAITGGEPLLNRDIPELLRKIKALGYSVKLDTNGSYPDLLKSIVNEGLVDYIAMDIKNSKEKYALTVGLPNFDLRPVEESVDFLLSGTVDFEFRTTIVKELHTEKDIAAIADWIAGAPRYFLQNFQESEHMIGSNLHAHSPEMLELLREIAARKIPGAALRGI
ncbi:MAG: anaerobic ribonucleoside-triphosphate reductase activating protein [Ruminococcaceae bacterium]|nr:anaerobic ribonucleoside-triphosphate reductase activating protein [Oscillospiraceae bacterium]